jgi:hypothetical protein
MKLVFTSSVIAVTLATFSLMAQPAPGPGGPAMSLPDPSKLPPVSKQEGVTFKKDIYPIFDAACMRCHGDEKPRASLQLDTLEGVLKGAKGNKDPQFHAVVVPGHSEQSRLVFAVSEIDGKTFMPPKPRAPKMPMGENGGTNAPATPPAHPWKPLTPEQIGLLRAWIDQGAK